MASRLGRIVLTVRSVESIAASVNFYHEAIGLPVVRVTDEWAELKASENTTLTLQVAKDEAQLSAGYSPWLTFSVNSMDERITKCIQLGAYLDGPIQYPAHGKVALLRSPDGHMVGLYEAASV